MPLWAIVDAVLFAVLGFGAIYWLLHRNPGEKPVGRGGAGYLDPDHDYATDTPRRPPHFHAGEPRNRPRGADTPGATSTRR